MAELKAHFQHEFSVQTLKYRNHTNALYKGWFVVNLNPVIKLPLCLDIVLHVFKRISRGEFIFLLHVLETHGSNPEVRMHKKYRRKIKECTHSERHTERFDD